MLEETLVRSESVIKLPEDIKEIFERSTCLYTKAQIDESLDRMAIEMGERLATKNPLFLCVVVGGIVPLGNLLPRLDFPLEVDYVHATRYGTQTQGGELHWKAEPNSDLQGRTVVVVDDILDSGITLAQVMDYCHKRGAREVFSAVIVDKHEARQPGGIPTADFTGLNVDNHFVFGYGMDFKGYLRNAPGIYSVAEEHM